MLESLTLRNFTAFADAEFNFADGLNVIVGENGTGKTHVLKAAYSLVYVSARGAKVGGTPGPTESYFQTAIADKLMGVFKPDNLGGLVRHGKKSFDLGATFRPAAENALEFSYTTTDGKDAATRGDGNHYGLGSSSSGITAIESMPSEWLKDLPVYLPTRELLSIYPGFVSVYETTYLSFEETWRDTCVLLGAPLARGSREGAIKELLAPLEKAMGGRVELDSSGRFYLQTNRAKTEMHLVAEGFRKLAMIAQLIAAGLLVDKGYLFWDGPEANLNPKTVKLVAQTILHLCRAGIQVFIASHSLFLLRELDILRHQSPFDEVKARLFGLHPSASGVKVRQGDGIEDIGDIDALQEELSQSDRYLEAEAK